MKIDILAGTFGDVLHAGMFLASEFSEIMRKICKKTYENIDRPCSFGSRNLKHKCYNVLKYNGLDFLERSRILFNIQCSKSSYDRVWPPLLPKNNIKKIIWIDMVFWYGVLQRTIVDLSMAPSCYIHCFHFLDIPSRSIWWYLNGTILQGFHPGQFLPTPQMRRYLEFGTPTTSAYVRGFWLTPLPTKQVAPKNLRCQTLKHPRYALQHRTTLRFVHQP